MEKYDLIRIADDIPVVLSRVQKPRLFQDLATLPFRAEEHTSDLEDASICEDYFDFALYGGECHNEAESSNKSDNSSLPGLTSATTPTPSDEGGASPPRDTEDRSKLKAKLKEVKQGDDKFTFPQRELKPKGEQSYNPNIHIQNPGQSPPTTTTEFPSSVGDGSYLTPPSSRRSSVRPSPPAGSPAPAARGKRTGPLKNGDEVAGVRAAGSCFCCKLRKVKCDPKNPCNKCVDKMGKYTSELGYPMNHQICFRRPLDNNSLFQLLSKSGRRRPCEACRSRGKVCQFEVFFDVPTGVTQPLKISIVVENYSSSSKIQQDDCSYRLDIDNLPAIAQLCEWSSAHMASQGTADFQTALDLLILRISRRPAPYSDLVQKVHQMRCLYKIWKQRELWYHMVPDKTPKKLPRLLQTGIGNIVRSSMRGLESDILKSLNKILTNPPAVKGQESLPLWASMMQMILMYRDLNSLARSASNYRPGHGHYDGGFQLIQASATLFSALVVACEVYFGKKSLKLSEDCNNGAMQENQNINSFLHVVETHRDEFLRNLSSQPGSLDQLLRVLRTATKKSNPAKRLKTSK